MQGVETMCAAKPCLGSDCNEKTVKEKNKTTSPMLSKVHLYSSLAVVLCCCLFAMSRAEAAPVNDHHNYRPSYLESLDTYMVNVEQHNRELDRMSREQTLSQSITRHIVERGETLGGIARMYGVDTGELAYWNGIDNPHFILPGQELDILLIDGTLHQVQEGETLRSIASSYRVDSEDIVRFNLLDDARSFSEGKALVIPGGQVPGEDKAIIQAALFNNASSKTRLVASRASSDIQGAPSFQWPLNGTITSRYGWRSGSFHYGLDIAAVHGSLVRAAAQGTVNETGYRGSYGLVVTIDHGSGWSTLYAHNSKVLVQSGEQVSSGQPVAKVGASGRATGPHVHFEIMYYGNRKDPLHYLDR